VLAKAKIKPKKVISYIIMREVKFSCEKRKLDEFVNNSHSVHIIVTLPNSIVIPRFDAITPSVIPRFDVVKTSRDLLVSPPFRHPSIFAKQKWSRDLRKRSPKRKTTIIINRH